ncbi:hypothetical protein [Catenulispora pinisilvae]|uniref:hypothetical protein n=1 Tax=Catenulispora pinisilvae TaxID=2705253 RepID=UPI001892348C|nr:hypothetical protein [Catenulispora pinisilvae]
MKVDHDPTPGDPDTVADIGQDLRDLADLIQRQASEIDSLRSVESWNSKAADEFRGKAHSASSDLRKAFKRYDVAAQVLGTSTNGSGYATELFQAQSMADKALRDAQDAQTEHRNLQQQRDRLPAGTASTDPQAVSLSQKIQTAQDTITRCRGQVENAAHIQETSARRAAGAIHHAINHDGFHDSFSDKFKADVGSVASTVWDGVKHGATDVAEITASVGNAMLHDPGADATLFGGLVLTAVGGAGEGLGFALDLTGVGAIPGVPINLGAGWLIAIGGTAALGASAKLGWDAAHSDRVMMSSDNGGGGSGTPKELSNRVRPPQAGDREYVVHNPNDPSDTITDYDEVGQDGKLWEEKTATGQDPRMDTTKWLNKNVTTKLDSFLRGRQYAQGYENASFGIDFTEPGATPEFKAAVEKAVTDWEAKNGVDVEVRWAS